MLDGQASWLFRLAFGPVSGLSNGAWSSQRHLT